jgi:hypothetical protein
LEFDAVIGAQDASLGVQELMCRRYEISGKVLITASCGVLWCHSYLGGWGKEFETSPGNIGKSQVKKTQIQASCGGAHL